MTGVLVARIGLPDHVAGPDAHDFLDYVDIAGRSVTDRTGSTALHEDPALVLETIRADRSRRWTVLLARASSGHPVGCAQVTTGVEEPEVAEVALFVVPTRTAPEAAVSLLAAVEGVVRSSGAPTTRLVTLHAPGSGGVGVQPSNGVGVLDRDDQVPALLAAGYRLGQVVRYSRLDLTRLHRRRLADVEREARRRAGSAHRPVWWTGPTPRHHRRGLADLLHLMQTDAPQGDVERGADPWDPDRVDERDERVRASDGLLGVAGVEDTASQRLVAISELIIGADRSSTTLTKNTIVHPDHRGRRLGTLAKCIALRRWRDLAPSSSEVLTANAEENEHMLAINTRLGFEPAWASGEWQRPARPDR